ELFQNNHHFDKTDANFAKRWFEFDLTYQIMRGFNFIGIIKLIDQKPVKIMSKQAIAA
ncbi:MAG: acyl-CoA desaturase, partial [Pedobacter sp.]|nr:acyl-CoA desaturase [Chitinophagaceae bacterium]